MRHARFALALFVVCLVAAPLVAQVPGGPVGNLNQPAGSVPNILFGDQTLAYLIFPSEQVSCPDAGFQLETVRVYLEFTENQVPVTLNVGGGLLRAVPEGDGYVPGDAIYFTESRPIVINEPGLQLIEVPVGDAATCEAIAEPYFLGLRFDGPAEANLVIDDQPAPGIEFIDSGNGFVDLNGFDKTSGGKVIIWGDIVCCIITGTESSSWHGIKQMFR
ncbi:MAG: hypothetical protein R3D98_11530 [Candidatus Krumholzibacteriia bacterium]